MFSFHFTAQIKTPKKNFKNFTLETTKLSESGFNRGNKPTYTKLTTIGVVTSVGAVQNILTPVLFATLEWVAAFCEQFSNGEFKNTFKFTANHALSSHF